MPERISAWKRVALWWQTRQHTPELMEMYCRELLTRCGAFRNDVEHTVRCTSEKGTGRLIVLVYLDRFDHSVWALSRHLEYYLMRQMKALYGIPVHSVHISVRREEAFRNLPKMRSSSELREMMRKSRRAMGPVAAAPPSAAPPRPGPEHTRPAETPAHERTSPIHLQQSSSGYVASELPDGGYAPSQAMTDDGYSPSLPGTDDGYEPSAPMPLEPAGGSGTRPEQGHPSKPLLTPVQFRAMLRQRREEVKQHAGGRRTDFAESNLPG